MNTLNEWLDALDPSVRDFFQQAKLSLKSLNRVAMQTTDALISVDTTGLLLQPLWELERPAPPSVRALSNAHFST